MLDCRFLLIRAAGRGAGCQRGRYDSRDDDKDRVHRSRRRQLRQRAAPPLRQSRRGGREFVEMKHDEQTGKVDTAESDASRRASRRGSASGRPKKARKSIEPAAGPPALRATSTALARSWGRLFRGGGKDPVASPFGAV